MRTDFCAQVTIRGDSDSESVSKASSVEKFGSFDSVSNESFKAIDQYKDYKPNCIKHDQKDDGLSSVGSSYKLSDKTFKMTLETKELDKGKTIKNF